MCKCGEQMARKHGKLLNVCKRKDSDNSACKNPGPPNRTETLADMASYDRKLAELARAVQVETEHWRRMETEWNSRVKAMEWEQLHDYAT